MPAFFRQQPSLLRVERENQGSCVPHFGEFCHMVGNNSLLRTIRKLYYLFSYMWDASFSQEGEELMLYNRIIKQGTINDPVGKSKPEFALPSTVN